MRCEVTGTRGEHTRQPRGQQEALRRAAFYFTWCVDAKVEGADGDACLVRGEPVRASLHDKIAERSEAAH